MLFTTPPHFPTASIRQISSIPATEKCPRVQIIAKKIVHLNAVLRRISRPSKSTVVFEIV